MPDTEFKSMVVRMFKDLRERMDDLSENLNKEMVSIKNDIDFFLLLVVSGSWRVQGSSRKLVAGGGRRRQSVS